MFRRQLDEDGIQARAQLPVLEFVVGFGIARCGGFVDRIGQRLARASEEELARVLDGLNEILG